MKKTLIIFAQAAICLVASAQQTTMWDHYLVHQYLINPAAAGLNGTNVFVDYRKQWAGFAGAPETQLIAVDGNILREQMGLGITVTNDQVNVLGRTGIQGAYAYRVKLGEQHFMRFGLSAGLNQNRIMFDKVIAEDQSELQIFNANQNASTFDAGAGFMYSIQRFQLGFAVAHLFSGKYFYENNYLSNSLSFENVRHFMANAQYRFDIKKGKWGIMPSVMVRTVQGMPLVYDGGVTGFYKKDAWINFRYGHQIGYTAGFGGVIAKNITAGYAYTYSAKGMAGYNQGSHDIIIGIRIQGGKKSTSDLDPKTLQEIKERNNELLERTDFLNSQNENLQRELEEQKKALKEAIYGLDSLKKRIENERESLEKFVKDNQASLDGGNAGGNSGNKNNNGTNTNNQGGGSTAGASGNADKVIDGKVYVIVGAMTRLEDAKNFQQIVMREYKEETFIIKDKTDYWFLIYTKSFDKKEDAIQERTRADKIDALGIFVGKPWYYIAK